MRFHSRVKLKYEHNKLIYQQGIIKMITIVSDNIIKTTSALINDKIHE